MKIFVATKLQSQKDTIGIEAKKNGSIESK